MPTTREVTERLRWFKNQHLAVAIWCEDDVLELAREKGISCSRKCAREIVDEIDRKHNATLGITWDTISDYLRKYVKAGNKNR